MATLPGVPLYARYGFREIERVTDRMPSGVELEFVRMSEGQVRLAGAAGQRVSRVTGLLSNRPQRCLIQ